MRESCNGEVAGPDGTAPGRVRERAEISPHAAAVTSVESQIPSWYCQHYKASEQTAFDMREN